MKLKCWLAAMVVAGAGAARAATLGGVGTHESLVDAKLLTEPKDSLLHAEMLDRWSVGIDFMQMDRLVSSDDGTEGTLMARVLSAQVGRDFFPWLTLYGTAGSSEARIGDEVDYADGEFKWSVGLRANWWHTDITDPTFLAGRVSLQSNGEFAQYQPDADMRWEESYANLTVNYEVFTEGAEDLDQYPYSIAYYGGAALSEIDGSVGDSDFSGDGNLGAIAGADVYLSHNLALGGQYQHFDENTISGSLRFHF